MYCIKWRVLWRWLKLKHVRINTQFLLINFWGFGSPLVVFIASHSEADNVGLFYCITFRNVVADWRWPHVLSHTRPGQGEALSLPLNPSGLWCAAWPIEWHSDSHRPGPWETWQNSKISSIQRSLLLYLAHPSSFLSHSREAFLLILGLSSHLFYESRHKYAHLYIHLYLYIFYPKT